MIYRSILYAGHVESPLAMMGKQIQSPITMSYSTNEKTWYKKHKDTPPKRVNFVMQKRHNTALINKNKRNMLAE